MLRSAVVGKIDVRVVRGKGRREWRGEERRFCVAGGSRCGNGVVGWLPGSSVAVVRKEFVGVDASKKHTFCG